MVVVVNLTVYAEKLKQHTIRSSMVKTLNNWRPTQKTTMIAGGHIFPNRWDKCLNLHKSSCTHFSNVTKTQITTTHYNENLLTESPCPQRGGDLGWTADNITEQFSTFFQHGWTWPFYFWQIRCADNENDETHNYFERISFATNDMQLSHKANKIWKISFIFYNTIGHLWSCMCHFQKEKYGISVPYTRNR